MTAAAFLGCGTREATTSHEVTISKEDLAGGRTFVGEYPIKVLCTTGMVADMVEHVGNSHVKVEALEAAADSTDAVAVEADEPPTQTTSSAPSPESTEVVAVEIDEHEPLLAIDQLMGAGVDPHLYKISPGDVSRLNGADVIFYSGLHLEGKLGEVLASQARKKPTMAITDRLERELLISVGPDQYDPHVWTDVELWSQTAAAVALLLSEFDPTHADEYARNAAAYQAELTRLDAWCNEQVQSIPAGQNVLVTAHDAFQYLGRAYGLEVRSIQGISTESEAGVKEINDLVKFITDRKIKAVFVESTISDRNVQALVEGCRAVGHDVVIGGNLYSDAMGDAGTDAGTYIGMTRHNIETIVGALK